MSTALLLGGYAAVLAAVGPRLVAWRSWTARAPRLGIWAWQALTVSVLASAALAGLLLAVPTVPVGGGVSGMVQACLAAAREQYAAPGRAAIGVAGAAVALFVLGRTSWCLAAGLLRARRDRTRHARQVGIVGAARPDLGVVVLPDVRPVAYCLPGRGHRIVVSTATLAALGLQELAAVLAHERAHIRGRHHLVLAYAEALVRAFPRFPLFTVAAAQVRRLVEMAADDAAAARTDALTLAGALLQMAGARTPAVALAAAGSDAAVRVCRLLGPRRPLGRLAGAVAALAAGVAVTVPLVLALQPTAAADMTSACPIPCPVAAPPDRY